MFLKDTLELIHPDWSVSPRVRAATTTRHGGLSDGPFASLNLATHVGDDPQRVAANRQRLSQTLHLPSEPLWLEQVHGTQVFECGQAPVAGIPCADASLTRTSGRVCAVLTADCMPILLAEREGRAVAAVHAGWRGLVAGVIEQTLAQMDEPPERIAAWLGPAIGPQAFEVGAEVRAACLAADAGAADAFVPSPAGRWLADLYALARRRLQQAGVCDLSGGDSCTYSDAQRFFSYRRDGRTGRMLSCIWLEAQ
nr:peptidoglycan editing factor PgeF [Rhabdochromatium marinum]